MSMKNVDHCVDKGTMASRYKEEILTVWSGPGGGHSLVDARGHEALVVCKHALPQKLIQLGRNVWCLIAWCFGFNEFFWEVKRKRINSRCQGRLARHTGPLETSYLRANLPSMETLVSNCIFCNKNLFLEAT